MDEQKQPIVPGDLTSDDRLWSALSWIPVSPLWPILAIVVLLIDETKGRPFVRYNAVLSIATGIVLIPVSVITFGLGALLYLVFFYWAYLAYQGQTVEVPFVSSFVRRQGWV